MRGGAVLLRWAAGAPSAKKEETPLKMGGKVGGG